MSQQAIPFGESITTNDIIDTLGFFDTWEDRYRYIIDLGKDLPPMDASFKDDQHLVKGCQSQVWIDAKLENGSIWLSADSDAFIVKGLLCVVLAAFNGKSPAEILEFDIEDYFRQLDLMRHISQTRGNGLRSMVSRIQSIAEENHPSVN